MPATFLEETLNNLESKGLRRRLKTVEGPQGCRITVDGKEVLNFCSNNYLGLADDVRLRSAATDCIAQMGLGTGASRLVCGNMLTHQKLEQRLAEFKETERAVVFSTGYMANIGIISGLFGKGDIILADKLNHASIIDGILLSGAEFRRYAHNDIKVLEDLLKKAQGYETKVIITDSVFSMDGDLAPLAEIVELAKKYG